MKCKSSLFFITAFILLLNGTAIAGQYDGKWSGDGVTFNVSNDQVTYFEITYYSGSCGVTTTEYFFNTVNISGGSFTYSRSSGIYCSTSYPYVTLYRNFSASFTSPTSCSVSWSAESCCGPGSGSKTANLVIEPNISVTPSDHTFDTINVGSSSSYTFEVANSGNANLSIGSLSIAGENASEFSVLNDYCSNQTLAPEASCTCDVRFQPNSLGENKSTTLQIPSNDPDTPTKDVALLGSTPVPAYFEISTIPSPQKMGVPFSVEIVAKDNNGAVFDAFQGTVNLTAQDGRWIWSDITIGGDSTISEFPLYTYYHDARTQDIYLANEIGGSAIIKGLALDVTTVPGQILNNWTIRIKHTPLNAYSAPALENSGWTVVYQNDESISTTGWVKFPFTTPFEYNGVDNLMIDFSFNNTSYTSNGIVHATDTDTGTIRSIHAYSNSDDGDPLLWNGSSPYPEACTYIRNIQLLVQNNTVSITPNVSGNFTSGAWTGNFTSGAWTGNIIINEAASGLIIKANDGNGHSGSSNLFDVSGNALVPIYRLLLRTR